MDYDICLQRHRTRDRRPWAPHDAELGWAAHNRTTDETAFARWFDEDSCFDGFAIQLALAVNMFDGAAVFSHVLTHPDIEERRIPALLSLLDGVRR